jgi:hypothetical protein
VTAERHDRIIASQSPNVEPMRKVRVIGIQTSASTKIAKPTVTILRSIPFASFCISITGLIPKDNQVFYTLSLIFLLVNLKIKAISLIKNSGGKKWSIG